MSYPCKLTPEVHKRIVELLRKGAFRESAARECRVSADALANWVKWGRDADPEDESKRIFLEFAADVDAAEAAIENEVQARILSSRSKGDARSLIMWLERRFPSRWGARKTLELTGPNGGPVQTGVVVLPAQRPIEVVQVRAAPPAPALLAPTEQPRDPAAE